MNTQTIIKNVNDLKCTDEEGDFIQTEFDSEIESFVSGLLDEGKFPMSMNFFATSEKLCCVIMFAEMTEQQKTQVRAQKSGLSILSEKIVTPS